VVRPAALSCSWSVVRGAWKRGTVTLQAPFPDRARGLGRLGRRQGPWTTTGSRRKSCSPRRARSPNEHAARALQRSSTAPALLRCS
jgi:hypothetical protein